MADETKRDMEALAKVLVDCPRRDNTLYHQLMAQARQVFAEAEAAIDGPVDVKLKAKRKRNGKYVVKWVFKPTK